MYNIKLEKMKKVMIGLFVGILFLMNSYDMYGQEQSQRGKKLPTFAELLKDMDTNDDGKLSRKEIKGPLKDDFDKVDVNEDGFITEKEFEKAPKPKGRKQY